MSNLIGVDLLLGVIATAGKSCVDLANEQKFAPAKPSEALHALAAKCQGNPDWCARVSGGSNE